MKKPLFTGVCTALVTPFTETGAVDYSRLEQQMERQIAAGVDALCICGTTGETPTLTRDEHLSLISFAVRQAKGRVKVLAGTGGNCTANALYITRCAEGFGADGALIVTPYYNKATPTGLVRHYEAIAKKTALPIVVYNVPSRTGMTVSPETYALLSQIPNVVGVKDASGDLAALPRIRAACGEEFAVWSGNDDTVVPTMALGGLGVISSAANLLPEAFIHLTHLCLGGQFGAAAKLQTRLAPLLRALYSAPNPIPLKCAMAHLGLDSGVLRLPLTPLEDGACAELMTVLDGSF